MPSPGLAELYERTHYRVRLAHGGHASIRIGRPLPDSLRANLPQADTPWAFVTAWNPLSVPQPVTVNRASQRALLAALRRQSPSVLLAGVGIGQRSHWREPSLFVAGVRFETLDRLMRPFRQHAIVRGIGARPAQLHWLE